MSVLRFRVMFEEDDTIFRDIEIKPSQTLSEFESVINSAYNLPATGTGNFFMSNDNWQKGKQIPGKAPTNDKQPKAKAKAITIPALLMFIDDPHQRFVYEYQGSQEFIFLVELMNVGNPEKGTVIYPVCIRSQGPSPFKKDDMSVHYSKRGVAAGEDEDDEEEAEPAVEEEEESLVVAAAEEEEVTYSESEEEAESEGDLMDGDAIKEDNDDDSVDEDFAGGDDFNPEDFNEASDEFEEDDLR